MRRFLLVVALGALAACGVPSASDEGNPPPNPKFFVCKYVTTPGEGERLQTGQNPISVSENAFPAGVIPAVGVEFNDAQGRSLIIAEDVGQPEPPTRDDCPPPNPPPTTTTTTEATTSTTTTTPPTSTTTTSPPTTSTSSTTTTTTSTVPGQTTTTTTTTLPPTFQFAGAATICIVEVPTIRITFGNTFPALTGQTGTLTMSDINGNVVSTQPLIYQPGTTVDLLYPGTSVNADGTIADVPGWILTNAGLWVRDPSDAFLREGINLRYEVNPVATAFVTYPPESSACANPENPPVTPPTRTPPTAPPVVPPGLPPTVPPTTTPHLPPTR